MSEIDGYHDQDWIIDEADGEAQKSGFYKTGYGVTEKIDRLILLLYI